MDSDAYPFPVSPESDLQNRYTGHGIQGITEKIHQDLGQTIAVT